VNNYVPGGNPQLSIANERLKLQAIAVWKEVKKLFIDQEMMSESWIEIRNMMTNLSP